MKWIGAWFWSRVRDKENSAQTLVRVAGNLFRIALTIIVVGIAVIAATSYSQNQEYRQRTAQSQRVSVTASFVRDHANDGCTPEFPISLTVRNDSDQTLMKMEVALSARRAGSSTNLLQYGSDRIRWDQIVPPGYVMRRCYRIPQETRGLQVVYSAQPVSYTVELQSTQDWMIEETNAVRSQ